MEGGSRGGGGEGTRIDEAGNLCVSFEACLMAFSLSGLSPGTGCGSRRHLYTEKQELRLPT